MHSSAPSGVHPFALRPGTSGDGQAVKTPGAAGWRDLPLPIHGNVRPEALPQGVVPPGQTARRLGAQQTPAERVQAELAFTLARPVAPIELRLVPARLLALEGEVAPQKLRAFQAEANHWRSLEDAAASMAAWFGDAKGSAGALAKVAHFIENRGLVDRALELKAEATPVNDRPAVEATGPWIRSAFRGEPNVYLSTLVAAAREDPTLVDELVRAHQKGVISQVGPKVILEVGPAAIGPLARMLGAPDPATVRAACSLLAEFGPLANAAAPALVAAYEQAIHPHDAARILETLAQIGGPQEAQRAKVIDATVLALRVGASQSVRAAERVIAAMAPGLDPRQVDALGPRALEALLPTLGSKGWSKVSLQQLLGARAGALLELGPPPQEVAEQLLQLAIAGRFSPVVRYGLSLGPTEYRAKAVERLLRDPSDFVRHAADLEFLAQFGATLPRPNALRGRIEQRLAHSVDNAEEPGLRGPALHLLLDLLPHAERVALLGRAMRAPGLIEAAKQALTTGVGRSFPAATREALLLGAS